MLTGKCKAYPLISGKYQMNSGRQYTKYKHYLWGNSNCTGEPTAVSHSELQTTTDILQVKAHSFL
jgi:hypothetical protein